MSMLPIAFDVTDFKGTLTIYTSLKLCEINKKRVLFLLTVDTDSRY